MPSGTADGAKMGDPTSLVAPFMANAAESVDLKLGVLPRAAWVLLEAYTHVRAANDGPMVPAITVAVSCLGA